MKKLFKAIPLVALLTLLLTFAAFAQTVTGTLPDNLFYSYNTDTGAMEISGSGPVPELVLVGNPYHTQVRKLILRDGITAIDSLAFASLPALESVSIPGDVKSIACDAFAYCHALSEIAVDLHNKTYSSLDGVLYSKNLDTLLLFPTGKAVSFKVPDSVKVIGEAAFCNSELTDITLPKGLGTIGKSAFSGSRYLEQIMLPSSLTGIGDEAFRSCAALSNISLPEKVVLGSNVFDVCQHLDFISAAAGSPYYKSVDGVLFDKSMSTLLIYPSGKRQTAYTVPFGVARIAGGAFNHAMNLRYLSMQEGLGQIDSFAITDCPSLMLLCLPASLHTVEENGIDCNTQLVETFYAGSAERFGWINFVGSAPYGSPAAYYRAVIGGLICYDSSASVSGLSVSVNGRPLMFTDQPPMLCNDRTLVPLRAIFEALGASVGWDDATETVTSTRGGVTISLAIGSNILYKNGVPITLDVPAMLVCDRTLVPVRAVSEAFGCTVGWDEATQTVAING